MENFLALQAAVARPPLAVLQGHAMLRLVNRRPPAALDGAVTFRIGRFVRGAGISSQLRSEQRDAAALLRLLQRNRAAARARD